MIPVRTKYDPHCTKKMKSLDLINNLLKLIQNIFDPNGTYWNSNGDMAMSVFCDGNKKKYNFILDSISLLEDVQLAKANYMKYGLSVRCPQILDSRSDSLRLEFSHIFPW